MTAMITDELPWISEPKVVSARPAEQPSWTFSKLLHECLRMRIPAAVETVQPVEEDPERWDGLA